jgi:hypothetical protein
MMRRPKHSMNEVVVPKEDFIPMTIIRKYYILTAGLLQGKNTGMSQTVHVPWTDTMSVSSFFSSGSNCHQLDVATAT